MGGHKFSKSKLLIVGLFGQEITFTKEKKIEKRSHQLRSFYLDIIVAYSICLKPFIKLSKITLMKMMMMDVLQLNCVHLFFHWVAVAGFYLDIFCH